MQSSTPRNHYDKRLSSNFISEGKPTPPVLMKQSSNNNKVLNPEKENFMTGDDRKEIEVISIQCKEDLHKNGMKKENETIA